MSDEFIKNCKQFPWSEVKGKNLLVVGLGGGADIVSAYAVAKALEKPGREIVYGNTKKKIENDLPGLAKHIFIIPKDLLVPQKLSGAHGSTKIDRMVPRGPKQCPWIFQLTKREESELATEIQKQGFDGLIGVDTGGDILQPVSCKEKRGRDRRMLDILLATGLPVSLIVIGLGSDGETPKAVLAEAIEFCQKQNLLKGRFDFSLILKSFEEFRQQLPDSRTPNIILKAKDCSETEMLIPRCLKPKIPISWLLSALLFEPMKDIEP